MNPEGLATAARNAARGPGGVTPRALARFAVCASVVFLVCFGVAAWLYPGGTSLDAHRVGYDLVDNYVCDAYRPVTYDGRSNPRGAPYGRAAMLALTLALVATAFASIAVFRGSAPRIGAFATRSTWVALVGMAGVVLTPLTAPGRIVHFVVVGLAAIPTLLATWSSTLGLVRVACPGDRAGTAARLTSAVTSLSVSVHFAQWLARASGVIGEVTSIPRFQKLVVLAALVWVATTWAWVEAATAKAGR